MPTPATSHPVQIDRFFSGPGSRGDAWQNLVELAEAWSNGSGNRGEFEAALTKMMVTEGFFAYPGHELMSAHKEKADANNAEAAARLARQITRTVLTRSYRQNAGEWEGLEEDERATADVLPPALGSAESHRPYFEVLIVTGAPATRWPALRTEWRRLRRPLDAFVYEPVLVGSFEDAFCATILNPDLAAVVIHEGFAFKSQFHLAGAGQPGIGLSSSGRRFPEKCGRDRRDN